MAAMNMMSTCVDDLFKQIISSEEKAREKKNNINEGLNQIKCLALLLAWPGA